MDTKIRKVITDAGKRGYDVTIRDVSYALMRVRFDDKLIPYTVIKGTGPEKESDVDAYDSMDKIQYLIRYFELETRPKNTDDKPSAALIEAIAKREEGTTDGTMSFEDNRAGIENQIAEILELKNQLIDKDGKCTDVKTMATLQKTEMDARSRLNDKFGASEKSKQQYVLVQPKYDYICPYTRHECLQITKERAMEKWNLIEKE